MALHRLSELDKWQLEHDDQDIRERPLVSATGAEVGVIKDLMVDLDDKRVAAVVTSLGEAYAVQDLEIREDRVVAHEGPISGGTSLDLGSRPARPGAYSGNVVPPRT